MILLSSLLIMSCRDVGKYSFEAVSFSESYYDTLEVQIIRAELLSGTVIDFAEKAYSDKLFDADARVGYSRFESEFDDIFDLLWQLHANEDFCGYYDGGEYYSETACFADSATDRICINIDRYDLGDEEIFSCLPHEGSHFLMGFVTSPHYSLSGIAAHRYEEEYGFQFYLEAVQEEFDYPLLLSDFYNTALDFENHKKGYIEEVSVQCYIDFTNEVNGLNDVKATLLTDSLIDERELEVYQEYIDETEARLEENKDNYGCAGNYYTDSDLSDNIYYISNLFRNEDDVGSVFFDFYTISQIEIEEILEDQGFCEDLIESCETGYDEGMDSWEHFFNTDWTDAYEVSSELDVEFDFTGSVVVTTSEDEHFYVFDTDDGTIIQNTYLEGISGDFEAEVVGEKLYFSDEGLREYDFSDLSFSSDDEGSIELASSTGSTSIGSYGTELIYSGSTQLKSYDKELGFLSWALDPAMSSESFGETVLIDNNLFVISDYPRLYAYDVSSVDDAGTSGDSSDDYAELEWSYDFLSASEISSLSGDSDVLYVVDISGILYAFDFELGDLLWSEDFGSTIYAIKVQEGRLYLGSGNSYYMAEVDSSGISIEWEYENVGTIWDKALVEGGIVYFGSDDGNLYALAAETGAFFWSYDSGAEIRSIPTICDSKLFFGNEMGQMIALDTFDGSELWRTSTAGEIEGMPVCYSYE